MEWTEKWGTRFQDWRRKKYITIFFFFAPMLKIQLVLKYCAPFPSGYYPRYKISDIRNLLFRICTKAPWILSLVVHILKKNQGCNIQYMLLLLSIKNCIYYIYQLLGRTTGTQAPMEGTNFYMCTYLDMQELISFLFVPS